MAPKSGKTNGGKFTGVRLVLATGATLSVLIGAQMLASANTTSATTTSTQTAVVTTTAPQTTDKTIVISDDEDTENSYQQTTTTATNPIFSAKIQPSPRTHSSR